MSYRALLSIQNVTVFRGDVVVLHSQDFRMELDEDFSNGEIYAEAVGKMKDRQEASMSCMTNPGLSGIGFKGMEERRAWIDTYADQTWEVQFHERGNAIDIRIVGKDASGELIFFRHVTRLAD